MSFAYADEEHASTDLWLYTENTSALYGQAKAIAKNLAKKMANGTYDADRAVVAWERLAESGAKRYVLEMCGGLWFDRFPPVVRKAAAVLLMESYQELVDDYCAELLGVKS